MLGAKLAVATYMWKTKMDDKAAKAAMSDRLSTASTSDCASSGKSPSESSSSGRSSSGRSNPGGSACCTTASDSTCSTGRSFEVDFAVEPTVLGVGGTCTVQAGTCRNTGRQVAVKSFARKNVDSGFWRMAKSESQILRSINHPHIVGLEGSYESEDAVHIVMESLEGGDLFERIVAEQGLEEKVAAGIAVQLIRALGYLHTQGLMHRDLKPENVMFAAPASKRVKLIDFGLACSWRQPKRQLGADGQWQQYAAPEVSAAAAYDWRADIWSLGSLLYTSLTAQFMYAGKPERVAQKSQRGQVDFCPEFFSLSMSARDFIESLLAPSPEARLDALQALSHPWIRQHARAEAAAAHAELVSLNAPLPRNSVSCFAGVAKLCNSVCSA